MSPRQRQDRVLLEEMRAIFERSGGTYGSPRIQRELAARGHRVSRRRVERLMRAGGLRARLARVYRPKAGTHRWFGQQPNHVRRTHATRPNQIWVGDLTYLAVGGRWWYSDRRPGSVLASGAGVAARGDPGLRVTRAVLDAALRRRRPTRPDLSQRPRQRVSGDDVSSALGRKRRAAEHDARRRAWGERAHGIVLPLAQGRRDPRAVVSDAWLTSAGSSVGTCGTTTTSACIRRWTISRPLTMNVEPRRTPRVYGTEGRSQARYGGGGCAAASYGVLAAQAKVRQYHAYRACSTLARARPGSST